MTVRKREYKDRHGQQIWDYDFFYNGIRYRKAGFTTKAEAEIAETKAKRDVHTGRKKPRQGSFASVVELFFQYREGKKADSTIRTEKRRSKILLKHFGHALIGAIGTEDIDAYVAGRLRGGKAHRSINLELSLLSSLFKFAISRRYAGHNPVKDVEYLKVRKGEHLIPSDEEFDRLVEEARKINVGPAGINNKHGTQLATYILLSVYTGLRPNEAFHLQWRDIDLEANLIKVCPKDGSPLKSGKFRAIEINEELKPVLISWKKEWREIFNGNAGGAGCHDWVFIHPQRPYQRAKGFRKSLEKAKKRAGISIHMTNYTFRHIFISKAVMCGVDYIALKKWTGHSSIKMIEDVYGHLNPKFRTEQMAKLHIGIRGQPKKD